MVLTGGFSPFCFLFCPGLQSMQWRLCLIQLIFSGNALIDSQVFLINLFGDSKLNHVDNED